MSTLERAIAMAAIAHQGQRNKADASCILHPLRVMLRVATEAECITAVLHDVVEDCDGWLFERLRSEGFSSEIIEALKSVTKRDGESHEDFIKCSILKLCSKGSVHSGRNHEREPARNPASSAANSAAIFQG